jgi:sugar phosphate isomerase/epimerase
MKIGVMIESFRDGLEGGLDAAARLGVDGVQLYVTSGETRFDKLLGEPAKDLLKKLQDRNLEFSAICGDFGGHGFMLAEENHRRVEDSKRIMDLALQLECSVVTTHIGTVPNRDGELDKGRDEYRTLADACGELARYGASVGATFAIETGPEPAAILRQFIDDVGEGKGLGVNFDPANLVMVVQDDIPQAVQQLAPFIVHTHAKDGVNLKPVDAEVLYKSFAGEAPEGFDPMDYISEEPLGSGDVDWAGYLQALKAIGFDGYLTIEREVGDNPYGDIELAVNFLREQLAPQ